MNEFMHTDGIKTVHDVDASEDNQDIQEVSELVTYVCV
jgi:hypothetical protein